MIFETFVESFQERKSQNHKITKSETFCAPEKTTFHSKKRNEMIN